MAQQSTSTLRITQSCHRRLIMIHHTIIPTRLDKNGSAEILCFRLSSCRFMKVCEDCTIGFDNVDMWTCLVCRASCHRQVPHYGGRLTSQRPQRFTQRLS